jgi:hypothetical protein
MISFRVTIARKFKIVYSTTISNKFGIKPKRHKSTDLMDRKKKQFVNQYLSET